MKNNNARSKNWYYVLYMFKGFAQTAPPPFEGNLEEASEFEGAVEFVLEDMERFPPESGTLELVPQTVVIPIGILLEEFIVKTFKLDEIKGLKRNLTPIKPGDPNLKGVTLLKYHSKADSIRNGVFRIYKATFVKKNDSEEGGSFFSPTSRTYSFTLPYTVIPQMLVDHLADLGDVTINDQVYQYLPGSVKLVQGKKYSTNS